MRVTSGHIKRPHNTSSQVISSASDIITGGGNDSNALSSHSISEAARGATIEAANAPATTVAFGDRRANARAVPTPVTMPIIKDTTMATKMLDPVNDAPSLSEGATYKEPCLSAFEKRPSSTALSSAHTSTHFEGDIVGAIVGEDVVGDSVGDVVGDDVVGESVGELVGDDVVGESVGELVGDDVVGESVGELVGVDVVGESVGEVVQSGSVTVHMHSTLTALRVQLEVVATRGAQPMDVPMGPVCGGSVFPHTFPSLKRKLRTVPASPVWHCVYSLPISPTSAAASRNPWLLVPSGP